jgi:hypothetical protein
MDYNNIEGLSPEEDGELYARHAEIKSLKDLEFQRGTTIPALFNMFYKFIQNPSTVSVETFKRMVDTDDVIGSGMDFLTTVLASRLGTYQHPSEEITQWVNKALEKVQGGFYNVIKELLYATASGFMVSEKCWANDELGFIVDRIIPMPPQTILFEVDRTGNIMPDGILQYQRNYNPALLGGGGLFGTGFSAAAFDAAGRPDPFAKVGDLAYPVRVSNTFQYLSIRIPKYKCIHYAFNAAGQFGNPYGRSLLRRAYKHWVMKDAILQMMSIALDRKGTPLMVVFADPNTTVRNQAKYNANNPNAKGQRDQGIRADVAAVNAFKELHNDSVIVLPGKKDQVFSVDSVDVTSNAEVFISALKFHNESMLRSMLIPPLVFTSGDGSGSYSLGQEHAKTFEKVLDGVDVGLKEVLLEQYVKQLIQFNFPKSAWEKDCVGTFTKKEMGIEDISKWMDAYEKAVNMGAASMNELDDLNKVRQALDLSEREEVMPVQEMTLPSEGEDDVIGPNSLGEVDKPGADTEDEEPENVPKKSA